MKHVEAQHSVSKSRKTADSDFENSDDSSSSDADSELSETRPLRFRKDDRYREFER